MSEPNPYEVLQLDPATSEEEIVRQAGRLRQRTADEDALAALRRAVQALTGLPEERALHALLTHPRPCYRWPAVERFAAAFRRPPTASSPVPPCPELDLAEFAALLKSAVAEELSLSPAPFEPVGASEGADEIQRQTAEALWQALLFRAKGS